MADLQDALQAVPGQQPYHLIVAGAADSAELSVVSFTATEKMGAPIEVRVTLPHPLQLARADYLKRDASFSIKADDGTLRRFSGFIARFSTLQTTKDLVKYEIVLRSHLARLEAVTRNKIFQHGTMPDILNSEDGQDAFVSTVWTHGCSPAG